MANSQSVSMSCVEPSLWTFEQTLLPFQEFGSAICCPVCVVQTGLGAPSVKLPVCARALVLLAVYVKLACRSLTCGDSQSSGISELPRVGYIREMYAKGYKKNAYS
jgi:hypothetical protein